MFLFLPLDPADRLSPRLTLQVVLVAPAGAHAARPFLRRVAHVLKGDPRAAQTQTDGFTRLPRSSGTLL